MTCENKVVSFRVGGRKDVWVDVDDRLSQSVQSVPRQQTFHWAVVVGVVQLPRVRHVVTDFALS